MAVAPVALLQAAYLFRKIPRLPEAAGARSGVIGSGEKPLRVLIFGESTAAGVGADTQMEALGGQVAVAFAAALDRPIAWRVVGKNGVTARRASAELTPQLENYACDLVIIALGANDTFRLRPVTVWQRDIVTMLFGIRHKLGPVPILFSGMPPVGQFPSLPMPLSQILGLRARLLNAGLQHSIAQLDGVWHVDTETVLSADPSFYGTDQFHPGPKGYALWGQLLAERYTQLSQEHYDNHHADDQNTASRC